MRVPEVERLAFALAVAAAVAACSGGPSPVDPRSQLDFGVEMARRSLWSEALFRFRQAQVEQPSNPRILNNMAVAYEALGQFEQALESYQQALRLDPGNRELKRNYARFVEFYQGFKPQEQEEDGQEAPRPPPAETDQGDGRHG